MLKVYVGSKSDKPVKKTIVQLEMQSNCSGLRGAGAVLGDRTPLPAGAGQSGMAS